MLVISLIKIIKMTLINKLNTVKIMIHQIVRHMFHFKIMHLVDKIVCNFKKIKILIFIKIKITPCLGIITMRT